MAARTLGGCIIRWRRSMPICARADVKACTSHVAPRRGSSPSWPAEIGAEEVIAGRLYEPWARKRDAVIAETLSQAGRKLTAHTRQPAA